MGNYSEYQAGPDISSSPIRLPSAAGGGTANVTSTPASHGVGGFLTAMAPMLGAINPIVGALGSLFSMVVGNRMRRSESDRSFRKEAEYNHPSAQVARMREAGLNPALMYGTGSAHAGNTHASIPHVQTPDNPFHERMAFNALQLGNESAMLNNQILRRTGQGAAITNHLNAERLKQEIITSQAMEEEWAFFKRTGYKDKGLLNFMFRVIDRGNTGTPYMH